MLYKVNYLYIMHIIPPTRIHCFLWVWIFYRLGFHERGVPLTYNDDQSEVTAILRLFDWTFHDELLGEWVAARFCGDFWAEKTIPMGKLTQNPLRLPLSNVGSGAPRFQWLDMRGVDGDHAGAKCWQMWQEKQDIVADRSMNSVARLLLSLSSSWVTPGTSLSSSVGWGDYNVTYLKVAPGT